MDLQRRSGHPRDRIGNGHRGVGVAASVEQDCVKVEAYFMDFVDELPLHVALIVVQLDLGKSLFELLEIVLERFASVDFGFAFSEQIQVWAVDNLDLQDRIGLKLSVKVK